MAKNPGKPRDNFTRNLVIAVVVGIVAVMLVPKLVSQQTDTSAAIPSQVSAAEGYGVVFNGELSGVPTIDIWEDFQCPVCAQFEALNGEYINSLVTEKKAKVIFHNLSFIGEESIAAANAAACAADENKYLEFHKTLLATQPSAENSGTWTTDYLINVGAAMNITSSSFKECVRNRTYAGYVANVAKDGAAKNVNSTPTVFINGKEIDRNTQYFNAEEFKKAVESAK